MIHISDVERLAAVVSDLQEKAASLVARLT